MNKVELIGRLTRDPDIRYAQGNTPLCIARSNLAVNRRYHKDGEQSADFISLVAFGKMGEFFEKYLKKGMKIAVVGRIQTGSYEKDGQRIYTCDVIVEESEFCEKKSDSERGSGQSESDNGFMNIPDGLEEDLPFS